jgi:hypothetical protein
VRGVAILLLLLLAVAGCADDRDYALQAQESAESVSSILQVAGVAVRDSGRLTRPYLTVVLTEAAEELDAAGDGFGAIQPPSYRSDQVRDRLLGRIQRARDLVEHLLIQVRRDGIEDPAGAAARLRELA